MKTELRNDIDPVDRAMSIIRDNDLAYGAMLTHDAVHDMLQIVTPDVASADTWKEYTLRVLNLVDSLRERLLVERHMYLQAVRGQGYRICRPQDQTQIAWNNGMARIKNGLRHIQRGIEHIERDALSLEDQRRNDEARIRAAALRAMVSKTNRENRIAKRSVAEPSAAGPSGAKQGKAQRS